MEERQLRSDVEFDWDEHSGSDIKFNDLLDNWRTAITRLHRAILEGAELEEAWDSSRTAGMSSFDRTSKTVRSELTNLFRALRKGKA